VLCCAWHSQVRTGTEGQPEELNRNLKRQLTTWAKSATENPTRRLKASNQQSSGPPTAPGDAIVAQSLPLCHGASAGDSYHDGFNPHLSCLAVSRWPEFPGLPDWM
jgi:hypothetical protein